jgi:phytoene dehydrogenase-like protein
MEVVTLGFFAVHAVVTLVFHNDFLVHYGPVVNNLVLAGMAFGSLLVHSPFTFEYAKEDWPEEVWSHPLFLRTNQIITGVWGGIFVMVAGLGALSLIYPDLYFILNVVLGYLLIGLGIAFSALFPNWFTRHTIKKELETQERYSWPDPAFDQHPAGANEHDVIVVGSGIGGLTAAALLAQRGLKVAVFEQHFLAGGYSTSWERGVRRPDGTRWRYVFDAGVHDVSGLGPNGPVRLLLEQLGIESKLDWRHMEHEYFIQGIHLRVPTDADEFAARLGELFPDEAGHIRAFFDEMQQVYREMYANVKKTGGVPMGPQTVEETLAYPAEHPHMYRRIEQPFSEMLDEFFTDDRLKRFLTALSGYLSDDPSHLSVMDMAPILGYYFDGGYYPAGGSQKLADALAEAIEAHGGEVHLRTPVKRIIIEDGRAAGVELAKTDDIHKAKAIISNADVKRTFTELVGLAHLPEDFRREIEDIQPATSAFMVFLGVDFVPDVAPITMTDDLGIMIPSKVDPSLAPEGHSAITLITLIPQEKAQAWERKTRGYTARKRAFGDELITRVEKVIPGLSEHITYRQEASPRTFERYAWTTAGSIYGFTWDSPKPPQKSPIPGLYLVGSGVKYGPGVEAVSISGVMVADTIYPNREED